MTTEALISQESSRIVQEVRDFLESTIVDLNITNDVEKKNALTLGNELQKKFSIIEKTRKAEKGIWDTKAKKVQEEFLPTLNLISEKKNTLSRALTEYDRKLEIQRQQRQKELEDIAQKERDRLEKLAGSREERRKMYTEKVEELREKLNKSSGDSEAYNTIAKEIRYYQAKADEFTEKAQQSQVAAAQVVTPIYKPEAPAANKGSRVTWKASVQIIDMKAFAAWCVEHDECQFLTVVESKLKDRVKEKEGRLEIPGLVCSYQPETGFSGR